MLNFNVVHDIENGTQRMSSLVILIWKIQVKKNVSTLCKMDDTCLVSVHYIPDCKMGNIAMHRIENPWFLYFIIYSETISLICQKICFLMVIIYYVIQSIIFYFTVIYTYYKTKSSAASVCLSVYLPVCLSAHEKLENY